MRIITLIVALATSGCAYTESQLRLTEQVQKGAQLLRQSQQERMQLVGQFHKLQRQRLDDAFDADVRQRPSLSPDWVIESRAAYAAALDALYRQQQSTQSADAATTRNLDAMDQALQRLLLLQSVQMKLFGMEGSGFGVQGPGQKTGTSIASP
jgi:hypothetical protein